MFECGMKYPIIFFPTFISSFNNFVNKVFSFLGSGHSPFIPLGLASRFMGNTFDSLHLKINQPSACRGQLRRFKFSASWLR